MGLHKGEKYSEDVRKFALTLRFYSPRGYDYVRAKFDKSLPHPVTIKKWYQKSSILASTGLCNRTIELLRGKVDEMKKAGKRLYCGVIHDEMNIAQLVQYDRHKKCFSGLISFGKISDNAENLPIATQVLVFLVSGINIPFHLPIAYYFVANLDGIDKVFLMQSIKKTLTDIGIIVPTGTFDGHATNVTACEIMGSSFDLNDLHPQYINDDDEVFPFFDAPHMLKLMRNVLADRKIIYDRLGRAIEWRHFEQLVDIKEKDDFITHKMTKAHINYHQRAMKVSLAAQTFSNSTAKSMKSLMDRNHPDFATASGTIEFTRRINNLFDVMNSRKQSDNIYKRPITRETSIEILSFLDDTADYLKTLTFEKGKNPVVDSRVKMGFKGMIINIENVKQIYQKLVQTKELDEFCVGRVVQCSLESLFSRCRSHSMLGSNTNPTTVQFTSIIKKLLVNNEVTSSIFSNTLDQLDILQVSSYVPKKPEQKFFCIEEDDSILETRSDIENVNTDNNPSTSSAINNANIDDSLDTSMALSEINKSIGLASISGEIDQRIKKKLIMKCELCCKVPTEDELLNIEAFPTSNYNKLPCKSTYLICHTTNEILEPKLLKINFNYHEIVHTSMTEIRSHSIFQNSRFDLHPHKYELIQSIVETFISIKAAYAAKKLTLENWVKMQESKKRKHNKTKHFQGR